MCLIDSRIVPCPQKRTRCIVARRKTPEKPRQEIERIFLSFSEAQEFLGVSHQTVYKLMKDGLPSHKIGKKRVFLKEDLVKWIKEH